MRKKIMRQKDQGLYEVRREHDACGIGAVVNINGTNDHSIIEYGKEILLNLHHRGAAGADEITGDGAGILGCSGSNCAACCGLSIFSSSTFVIIFIFWLMLICVVLRYQKPKM